MRDFVREKRWQLHSAGLSLREKNEGMDGMGWRGVVAFL